MTSSSSKRTHDVYISSSDDSNTKSAVGPSSKRVRSDPDPALWSTISSLPAAMAQSILYQLCLQNPMLVSLVQNAQREHLAQQAAQEAAKPPVNFDHYSRSCWHALNTEYKGMRGSDQYEAA
ncbi:hypothetical protein EG329_012102 [Mollisiaceae sp. DMI_Dod_QoI]|nr:hypothetical protein EG329_012102 [Helotiales sp. DMI_Dod_QoI]